METRTFQELCVTSLAFSGCRPGTKQVLSDAKFTKKKLSAKLIRPDPLQSFKVTVRPNGITDREKLFVD